MTKKLILCAMLAVLGGCSGLQNTTSPVPSNTPPVWPHATSIALHTLELLLPLVQQTIANGTSWSPDIRQVLDQTIRDATDSLHLANTSLDTYTRTPSVDSQCKVHYYAEQALTGSLQLIRLLQDFGVQVGSDVVAAVGGLGPVIDILQPGCTALLPAKPDASPRTVRAAWSSAQQRIQSVLSSRSP